MKIVIANSVGIGEKGERYVHFPSRWSAAEEPSWYDHNKGWMTFYPFMLAYASALLKRDTEHDVKFLDGNLNNWDVDTYREKILPEKPDLLVMECSTLSFPLDTRLARAVKDATGCKVALAGQHPTAFPDEALKAGADYVLRGEYEFTLLELARGEDPATIAGLHPNPTRQLCDPNDLPWPEDEDVRRIDYMEPVVNEYRELEMFASRGCPLACDFCVAANVYYGGAGSWRPRNVGDVTDEIAAMRARYPEMEGVFFDDEVHNGRKDFIVALCKSIMDKGLDDLKYNAMCGYWNMDEEMLALMKKAGYYKLRVGIETASPATAKGIGKSHSLKRLYRALEAAKRVGIKMYGTFTYGATGSTPDSDAETTELIKDLLEKGLLFDLQISICTPQPGTPFYKRLQDSNALPDGDWAAFDGGRNVVQNRADYPAEVIEKTVSQARRAAALFGGPRFAGCDYGALRGRFTKDDNILVIGSGPPWQTREVINQLEAEGLKPALLIREGLDEEFKGYQRWLFGEGRLDRQSLDGIRFQELKERNFTAAIIQVNHTCGDLSDYENVYRLARELAERQTGIDVTGTVMEAGAFEAPVTEKEKG